ncbi:hypothetical protein S7711_05795 [Stachybotrys chartarum IBT 7711]|uniref:Uncharacterized protein n=1 Tax=Stachybotrys chartarum (strain CBS 109288 / IBT 7711) TaxID=1280523 RepID=A0A084ATI6_STACB|nr:hypothetical protein S7711_05795 [Stachybotrys chartarum IBT 7711]
MYVTDWIPEPQDYHKAAANAGLTLGMPRPAYVESVAEIDDDRTPPSNDLNPGLDGGTVQAVNPAPIIDSTHGDPAENYRHVSGTRGDGRYSADLPIQYVERNPRPPPLRPPRADSGSIISVRPPSLPRDRPRRRHSDSSDAADADVEMSKAEYERILGTRPVQSTTYSRHPRSKYLAELETQWARRELLELPRDSEAEEQMESGKEQARQAGNFSRDDQDAWGSTFTYGRRNKHEDDRRRSYRRSATPPPPPPPPPRSPVRSRRRISYSQALGDDAFAYGGFSGGGKCFRQVETDGLSVTLQVKRNNETRASVAQKLNDDGRSAILEALAWRQPKTNLPQASATCDLLAIHAIEYSVGQGGQSKTVLVCPGGPQKHDTASESVQLRWLHVQRQTLKFQVLQRLVLNCHYIPNDLLSVALTALDEVETRFARTSEHGSYIEPGSIVRFVGKYLGGKPRSHGKPTETEPVIFLSSPHLQIQKAATRSGTDEGYGARTLLQSLYGYDVGGDRESTQVIKKSGISKQLLHVSQLWCLLIGSSILITFSDQSAQTIRGDTVSVDDRSWGSEPITLHIFDMYGRTYNTVVDPDYTYVDLLRHAVALVQGDASDALAYELLCTDNEVLTPPKWLELLQSPSSQPLLLSLQRRMIDEWFTVAKPRSLYPPSPPASDGSIEICTLEREHIMMISPGSGRESRAETAQSGQVEDPAKEYMRSRAPLITKEDAKKAAAAEHPVLPPSIAGLQREDHLYHYQEDCKMVRPLLKEVLSTTTTEAHGTAEATDIWEHRDLVPQARLQVIGHGEIRASLANRTKRRLQCLPQCKVRSPNQTVPDQDNDLAREQSSPKNMQKNLRSAPGDQASVAAAEPSRHLSEAIGISGTVRGTEPDKEPIRSDEQQESQDRNYHDQDQSRTKRSDLTYHFGHNSSSDSDNSRKGLDSSSSNIRARRYRSVPSKRPYSVQDTDWAVGYGGSREPRDISYKTTATEYDYHKSAQGRSVVGPPSHRPPVAVGQTSFYPYRSGTSRYDSRTNPYDGRYAYPSSRRKDESLSGGRTWVENVENAAQVANDASEDEEEPEIFDLDTASENRGQTSEENTVATDDGYMTSSTSNETSFSEPRSEKERARGGDNPHLGITLEHGAVLRNDPMDEPGDCREEAELRSSVPEPPTASARPSSNLGTDQDVSDRRRDSLPRSAQTYRRQVMPERDAIPITEVLETPPVTRAAPLQDVHTYPPTDKHHTRRGANVRFAMDTGAGEEKPKKSRAQYLSNRDAAATVHESAGHKSYVSAPFLTWRLRSETGERAPEEVEKTTMKVLGAINKTLLDGNYGKLYGRGYNCTLSDLMQRHQHLSNDFEVENPVQTPNEVHIDNQDSSNAPSKPAGNPFDGIYHASGGNVDGDVGTEPGAREPPGGGRDSEKQKPDDTATNSERPGMGSTAHSDNCTPSHARPPGTVHAMTHEKILMQQLLDISQEILQAFLPDSGSPVTHHVAVRFWGAVDSIFRHLLWDTRKTRATDGPAYVISKFHVMPASPSGSSLRPSIPWQECASCRARTHYATVTSALEHLHAAHFGCSGKTDRPFDDPCFVWIRHRWDGGYKTPTPGVGVSGSVEQFIDDLLTLRNYVQELQLLTAQLQGRKTTRPHLPNNLVLAFQQILTMYVMRAHSLSLQNRYYSIAAEGSAGQNPDLISRKMRELQDMEEGARYSAQNMLQDAKKDIVLLGSTSRDVNSLGAESVGAEFLVLNLITNMQNRKILGNVLPLHTKNNSDADYIQLYRDYAANLRFRANRRPQRRLFLDINALQEEMAALVVVNAAQKTLLEKYIKLTSPQSFRKTTQTRMRLHRTEREFSSKQQRILDTRDTQINDLADSSRYLKEQVKQTIEIVEEDHGKAIRVFTIVTLFFLPLSFVSSFMGMNTTDIRDMEWNQRIFWATSVPVTVAVVTAAQGGDEEKKEDEDGSGWRKEERRPRDAREGVGEKGDDGFVGVLGIHPLAPKLQSKVMMLVGVPQDISR